MNLIDTFQDLVANVPDLVQPLIVAAAAAIPFVEGEGAATIGILGGMNPVVAATAAVIGNFVCVAVLVLLTARTRSAVVTAHRSRRRVAAGGAGETAVRVEETSASGDDRGAARRAKFQRAFERYGVPGVSLLGPLLLPTQFTATMLAGAGVGVARILAWQAVAIVGWTTLLTLIVTGVLSVAH
ncbi:small multidrug efflux protein [Microbacterium sp. M3]|uniref:Small multidrug efflux protein n=1 Tax=Microbacterium arthrosphaerae TaxID=792652 RepID=A0ABU4H0Z4_9MICO|nr:MULTISPECIES: small multidrug efflux protein [Microbacterium]MDW4572422.1 small multidrug efflux protein [Microbacterium arthrosphaerae]MDW7606277.1 small multidrug efflux protein [Microbacterium sp. M3]